MLQLTMDLALDHVHQLLGTALTLLHEFFDAVLDIATDILATAHECLHKFFGLGRGDAGHGHADFKHLSQRVLFAHDTERIGIWRYFSTVVSPACFRSVMTIPLTIGPT